MFDFPNTSNPGDILLSDAITLMVTFLFAGKILIIGGGIANFTNVSATFKVNLKRSF